MVAPGLGDSMTRGWAYIAHNVIHDLAALNKTETLLWDAWGMQLGDRVGLRIPRVVTSFDVNGGPPRQVDVSRALGR